MNELKENQERIEKGGVNSGHAEERTEQKKESASTKTAKPATSCECPPGCVGLPCCT
jgi:hypothetical protein